MNAQPAQDNFDAMNDSIAAAVKDEDDPAVYIPPGVWRVVLSSQLGRQSLTIPPKRLTILGEGIERSVIEFERLVEIPLPNVAGFSVSDGTELILRNVTLRGAGEGEPDLESFDVDTANVFSHFRAVWLTGTFVSQTRVVLQSVGIGGTFSYGVEVDKDSVPGNDVTVEITNSVLSALFCSVKVNDEAPQSALTLRIDRTRFSDTKDAGFVHIGCAPHTVLELSECRFQNAYWAIYQGLSKLIGVPWPVGYLLPSAGARFDRCRIDPSVVTGIEAVGTGLARITDCHFENVGDAIMFGSPARVAGCIFVGTCSLNSSSLLGASATVPLISIFGSHFEGPRNQLICGHEGALWRVSNCLWENQNAPTIALIEQTKANTIEVVNCAFLSAEEGQGVSAAISAIGKVVVLRSVFRGPFLNSIIEANGPATIEIA